MKRLDGKFLNGNLTVYTISYKVISPDENVKKNLKEIKQLKNGVSPGLKIVKGVPLKIWVWLNCRLCVKKQKEPDVHCLCSINNKKKENFTYG